MTDSLNQCRIREPFIQGSRKHRINTVQGVIGTRALVQAELEFIDIPLQMLRHDMMIDPVDPTLQDRPHAFNSVGVHIAVNKLLSTVFDCVMIVEQSVESGIAAVVVGMKDRTRLDIREDRTVDMVAVGGVQRRGNNAAFPDGVRTRAFTHANDGGFPHGATSGFEFLGFVFVAFKATDKGFVHFDNASQWVMRRPAGFTEALEHEPRRPLLYANLFRQLDAGNAFASRDQFVHPQNPFIERDMRALHDGLGADGEYFKTCVTAIITTFFCAYAVIFLAVWALWAIRPTFLFHEVTGGLLVWKHLKDLVCANG